MLPFLKDEDPKVRTYAAIAIGDIGIRNKKVSDELFSAFALDKENQNDFIKALSKVGIVDDSFARELVLKITKNLGYSVEIEALGNLGAIASSSVPVIMMSLEHNYVEEHRYYAAKALGKLGSHALIAIPSLVAVLENNVEQKEYSTGCIGTWVGGDYTYSSKIREAAAEALGMMGKNASIAIPTLTKILQDENELVRKAAEKALLRIRKK